MSRAARALRLLVPRSPSARVLLACALAIALFWLGREIVIWSALRRAASLARRVGDTARQVLPDSGPGTPAEPDPLSWLLPPESPSDAVEFVPPPQASAEHAVPRARPLGPPPSPVVTMKADVVLSLAERRAVPRGAFRAASGDLPAGIEILDGAGLGIGWFPGDRLIAVGGAPVLDRAQIIRAVLQERARRAPVIAATLARRTREGVATYQVLVEQPYPAEGVLAPSEP